MNIPQPAVAGSKTSMIFNNTNQFMLFKTELQKVMRTKPGFSFNVQVHLYLVVTFKRSSLFHIVNFGTADRLLGVQCFLGG